MLGYGDLKPIKETIEFILGEQPKSGMSKAHLFLEIGKMHPTVTHEEVQAVFLTMYVLGDVITRHQHIVALPAPETEATNG